MLPVVSYWKKIGQKISCSGGKGNKKKSNDMHFNFLHSWQVTPEDAVLIQKELAGRIILEDNPLQFKIVAGADACYRGGKVYGAAAVFSLPQLDLLDQAVACREISFPYIPGLLSFREGPVLLDCLGKLSRITRGDYFRRARDSPSRGALAWRPILDSSSGSRQWAAPRKSWSENLRSRIFPAAPGPP